MRRPLFSPRASAAIDLLLVLALLVTLYGALRTSERKRCEVEGGYWEPWAGLLGTCLPMASEPLPYVHQAAQEPRSTPEGTLTPTPAPIARPGASQLDSARLPTTQQQSGRASGRTRASVTQRDQGAALAPLTFRNPRRATVWPRAAAPIGRPPRTRAWAVNGAEGTSALRLETPVLTLLERGVIRTTLLPAPPKGPERGGDARP